MLTDVKTMSVLIACSSGFIEREHSRGRIGAHRVFNILLTHRDIVDEAHPGQPSRSEQPCGAVRGGLLLQRIASRRSRYSTSVKPARH